MDFKSRTPAASSVARTFAGLRTESENSYRVQRAKKSGDKADNRVDTHLSRPDDAVQDTLNISGYSEHFRIF